MDNRLREYDKKKEEAKTQKLQNELIRNAEKSKEASIGEFAKMQNELLRNPLFRHTGAGRYPCFTTHLEKPGSRPAPG